MKRTFFILLAALALSSCSQKTTVELPADKVETQLSVSIKGTTKMSKATAADPTETQINSAKAFVFRGSDDNAILDGQPFDVNTDGSDTHTKVTTAASWIFMVVNTDLSTADLAEIRTLGDLKTLTASLFDGEDLTQQSGELIMWGANTIAKGMDSYTAQVVLRFAPAKIVYTYFIDAANATDLTDRQITIFNAQGVTRLIPSSSVASSTDSYQSLLPAALSYYAGTDMSGFTVKPATSIVKAALNTINANTERAAHTYYLFESDASAQTPTIIALSGVYAGQRLYYPIACSDKDASAGTSFSALRAGQQYDITIGIKNLHAGSEDPTAPVSSTDLSVTVTEAAWDTAIEWNKEFN